MPQGDYIEEFRKKHGTRLDHEERTRKREARSVHRAGVVARSLTGLKAKIHNKQRFKQKAVMKKTLAMHAVKQKKKRLGDGEDDNEDDGGDPARVRDGAVPSYLLDREQVSRSKVLSNTVKQKRKEKAGKWDVPLPKVRAVAEDEMFRVMKSGKRKNKEWKRMVTKVTFVGEGFTRKPPKYERFIRPMGLRFKKAHITHPELKTTFCLDIIGVKKNPQGVAYTQLGVITKGTVIEVNVSDLGLVTNAGKVVWGKYAQVTNNPENDGCINGVLLV